jgi:hypothetical protein
MAFILERMGNKRLVALVLAGTWLGACSSNAPLEQSSGGSARATTVQLDTTATLPTETCRLLTPREVGTLTGQPVQQQAGGEACRFVQADQPNSPDAVVVVSYRPASAFTIVQTGNRLKRRNILAVNGLGREAYYDDFHGDLYVQLPERTLVIGLPRADRGYSRWQVAKALGQLAMARLASPAPPATAQ